MTKTMAHALPMDDEAAADGWIKWEGGVCPVKEDTIVRIGMRCGQEEVGPARIFYWDHEGAGGDVVAYRILATRPWQKAAPPANDNPPAIATFTPWGTTYISHPQEDAFMPDNYAVYPAIRPAPPIAIVDPSFCDRVLGAPAPDVKATIADEAKRIVSGARRSAYGKPEDNFARIAAYWNAYAQCKGWDVVFTAADVSPMMRGMKEARLVETPDHRDSFVDMVGYTLTGAEINGVAA